MSNYETTQRKRNLIVGFFVLTAIIALVFLIIKFGELPIVVNKLRSFRIYVQFSSAGNVEKNTPVYFCGYPIGEVIDVMPPSVLKDLSTGKEYYQSKVTLNIRERYATIPSNAAIKIVTRGLGSSYIEIKVDPSKALEPVDVNHPETVYLLNNMLLQGCSGSQSEFFPEEMQEKIDGLFVSLKSLVDNANKILGDDTNRKNIRQTLANLSSASGQAEDTLKRLDEFGAKGSVLAEQLASATKQLSSILEKIDEGEGTASRFLNDAKLYESLLENSRQIEVLIEQLKEAVATAKEKGIPIKLK